MERQDVLWLAGLLEGEGCFNYRPEKNQVRVSIEMNDRDVIERVAALWGSKVGYRRARLSGTCAICDGSPSKCGVSKSYKNGLIPLRVMIEDYGFEVRSQESFQTAIYGEKAINLMRLVWPLMGNRRGAKIEEILKSRGEVLL